MSIINEMFEVKAEVENAYLDAERELAETGKVSDSTQERISVLLQDQETVITSLCNWYLKTEARLAGKKAEYEVIEDKIAADLAELQDTLDRVGGYIKTALPAGDGVQVANDSVYCYYSPSQETIIEDESAIPIEFTEYIPKISVKAIRDLLKSGGEVPGARLLQKYNLQVKVGGIRAMKNAKNRMKKRVEK